MSDKIKKINRQNVVTTADDSVKVVLNDDTKRLLQNITIANLRTLIASGIALIEKVIASEQTIALFAAASAGYTFQQGDIIVITDSESTVLLYMYVGGTKTDVANYLLVDASQVDWTAILNKPAWATNLDASLQFKDLEAVPVNSANFNTRILQDNIGVQSLDWETRQLKDVAGSEIINFANYVKVATDIQQVKAEYFYKSDTAGDAVDDLRFYNSGGAFIIEKCTVLNATKGAGTWVEVFNSSTSSNVTFASNSEVLARTVNNKIVSPANIDGGVKRYKALISQSGTDAPTATILENTLGEVPVWSYGSSTEYLLTGSNNLFPIAKTFINFECEHYDIYAIHMGDLNQKIIGIQDVNSSHLDHGRILIEVYP